MKRYLLAMGLIALFHQGGGAAEPGVEWLDRSFAHYLILRHDYDKAGLSKRVPPTSSLFRKNVFLVEPRRYGTKAPVKRFCMKEFEGLVEAHFKSSNYEFKTFMNELRDLLAIEQLPSRMTPEEFQIFLENPKSKRFAPLGELVLNGDHQERVLAKVQSQYKFSTVREVIESLWDSNMGSLHRNLSHDDCEVLRQAIDDLLDKDGDWEFCDLTLTKTREVPDDYLERFGFVLKPSGK